MVTPIANIDIPLRLASLAILSASMRLLWLSTLTLLVRIPLEHSIQHYVIRRVWKYQRGHQNPYIWKKNRQHNSQKKKVQKDKQRSTKHTHKAKDRVTRTRQNTGDELRCSGRVGTFCSTSGTRGVNLVTNPVINHEWGKDRVVLTTSGTYPWLCA